ncbi:MAG: hypothetical protein LUE91_01455 [Oscillospiraceae bacterium]|nr:hypothetical protein [Oscillospiraceae bacterium]
MDENNPNARRGKDFSTYIACEFHDEADGGGFVTGVVFDCRSDGSRQDRFFIYVGTLPENCFIENGEAMEISSLRQFLKQHYAWAEIYDSQKKVPEKYALPLKRPQRAGASDDEKSGIVPSNCKYSAVHHGKHLRHPGQAGYRSHAAKYTGLQTP